MVELWVFRGDDGRCIDGLGVEELVQNARTRWFIIVERSNASTAMNDDVENVSRTSGFLEPDCVGGSKSCLPGEVVLHVTQRLLPSLQRNPPVLY